LKFEQLKNLKTTFTALCLMVYEFIIHSFIHSFKTLGLLLRGAPSPVTAKEDGLEGDVVEHGSRISPVRH